MEKIILICEKTIDKFENKLPIYFHGWLMENIEPEIAEIWHSNTLKPYSIYVSEEKESVLFEINLLKEPAFSSIKNLLLDKQLNEIRLDSSAQKDFKITQKQALTLDQKELADIFYRSNASNQFTIKFLSSTSFKRNGEYLMFPDIELIIKSLMNQYNFVFESSAAIDLELLDELVDKTKIVSYRTFSSYHPIHKTFIPGFKGDIKIRCKGNQTITNYLAMLIKFSNFSGIGIKTTMGMGAVKAKELKRGGKHGKSSQ